MENEEIKQLEQEHGDTNKSDTRNDNENITVDSSIIKELVGAIREQTEIFKTQKGVQHVEIKKEESEPLATPVDHINKIYNDLLDRNNKYKNPSPTRDYEQFIYTCKRMGIPDEEIARVIMNDAL